MFSTRSPETKRRRVARGLFVGVAPPGEEGGGRVGGEAKKIKEYIANQYKNDKMVKQLSITETIDPFKKK